MPLRVSVGEPDPPIATPVVPAVALRKPEIDESWTVTTDDGNASMSATEIPVPCRSSVTFSVAV